MFSGSAVVITTNNNIHKNHCSLQCMMCGENADFVKILSCSGLCLLYVYMCMLQ